MSNQDTIKPFAGTVVHGVKHSQYWSPFDKKYGAGGSDEYPLRTEVEKRIKNKNSILQLKNTEVRIEPTNRCNFNCIMCPRDTHDRAQGVMPFQFFKSIIDEISLMGAKHVVIQNFGEPFLDSGLEDKIHYCTQKELTTYIISNASRLHFPSKSEFAKSYGSISKMEAAIYAGLTELRLSFYGTSPDTYNNVMKGGRFEETRNNIENLIKIRNRIGRMGISPTRKIETLLPEISIYYLDLPENKNELNEFLKFTADLADYIEVWKPHNYGLGRENVYRDINADELTSCGRPDNGPLQINWQGIVVPCCYDYNQQIPLGNIALQTIEEVLTGEPYRELRRCHRQKTFKDVAYCNRCDQLREHSDAIIYTTNEIHKKLANDEIVKTINTNAGVFIR